MWRPVLFALVGIANTAIDLTTYLGLTRFAHIDPLMANVLAYSLGSLHGYIVNGKLTFRDSRTQLLALSSQLRFATTASSSVLVSTASMFVLLQLFPDLAAKIISVGVTFGVNYLLSCRFVYKPAT
jgi:putative flippase GtrA